MCVILHILCFKMSAIDTTFNFCLTCHFFESYCTLGQVPIFTARCTMHSAKRGLAIACRLSVCDVGDL